MRMSASCRRDPGAVRGFSLLELLIVLAIMSMTVALVAPRMVKTVDAIAGSGERAEVQRQIEDLPLKARRQAAPIVAVPQADLAPLLDLPEGWKVSALTALRVEANGICAAAALRVEGLGAVEEWRVAAPDCSTGYVAQ